MNKEKEKEEEEEEIQKWAVEMRRYIDDTQIGNVWPIFERIHRLIETDSHMYSFVDRGIPKEGDYASILLINIDISAKDSLVVSNTHRTAGKFSFEKYQYIFRKTTIPVRDDIYIYSADVLYIHNANTSKIIEVSMRDDMFIFEFNEESSLYHKATATMSALFFSKRNAIDNGIGNLVTCIPSNYKRVAYGLDIVSAAIWPHVNSLGLNGIIFYYNSERENIKYTMNGVKQEMVGVGVNKTELLRYIYGIENISAMVKGSGGMYSLQCIYGTVKNFYANGNQRMGIEWTVVLSSNEHEIIMPSHFRDGWDL